MTARRIERLGRDNWTRAPRTAGMRAKADPVLMPIDVPSQPVARLVRAVGRLFL